MPNFAMEMRRRRHPEALIQRVVLREPVRFLSQSPQVRAAGRRATKPARVASADGSTPRAGSNRTVAPPHLLHQHPSRGRAGRRSMPTPQRYAPALKARFSPTAPFGLGLRLSARDARELLDGRALERLPGVPRCRGALRRDHQRLSLRTVPRHAGQGGGLRARLARRGTGALHRSI